MTDPDPKIVFDPATPGNRWRVFDSLRGRGPLRLGRTSWMLIDYEDVRAALADPARFSSDQRQSSNPVFRSSRLIFDDPPRHTSLRRLVSAAFTPRRVAAQRDWIRAAADGLLDALAPGDDFVAGYAVPLPVRVIAHTLGVPTDQVDQLKTWTDDRSFVTYHGGDGRPRTSELAQAEAGCAALEDWFAELVNDRRRSPRDDLLTAFTTAEVDGERLTDEEIVGVATVLLTAGNITTTRLLSVMANALARQPELFIRLKRQPDLAEPFIEECLRFQSPLQFPIRRAACDAHLGGVTIPAGHSVMIGIGPANRDRAAFDDPDELRLDRSEPHLAFGHGIHFCAGAALARLEAHITVEALCDRYETLSFWADPVPENDGIAHCGYSELRLT